MGKLKTKNYKFSHYLVMRLLLCAMLLTGSAGVWADQKTAKWDAYNYNTGNIDSLNSNGILVKFTNGEVSSQVKSNRNFQFKRKTAGSIKVTAPKGYRVYQIYVHDDYKNAFSSATTGYNISSSSKSCTVKVNDGSFPLKEVVCNSPATKDNGTNFKYLEVICVKESPTLQSSYKGYVGSSLKLSQFDGYDVDFTSSDPSIADCSGNTLYLKAKGKATITATIKGNENYASNESSMSVEVMQTALSASLSYTSKTYNAWDAMVAPTLTTPSDYKGAISYSSSNTSIVKVDKDGNISFGGSVYGKTATITVSLAAAGKYTAVTLSYQITINEIKNCLKFTAEQAGSTISFNASGNGGYGNVQTSTDGLKWTDYTRGTKITLRNVGDKVYFKGDYRGTVSNYSKFAMTGKIAASGNIMTLTDGHNPTTSLKDKAFVFYYLFESCSALSSAPALPATELPGYCYNKMFTGCTSLTSAPALPATTLTDYCYYDMFDGCTKLTSAPALPATSLADYCYAFMFNGCTSLASAPALPAREMADNCYYKMFSGCTSLTSAPALPATKMDFYCYSYMFDGCTKLTTAPALPATTLAKECYRNMFSGCTSLTSAPALPATELADWCYQYMFSGCTSLTSAPALPATKLAYYCYYNMFDGCTKLNSIKVAFTDWNDGGNSTSWWVNGVASAGTFICKAELAKEFSKDRIPEGWTVQELPDYLCFTAEEAGSTISFNAYEDGGSGNVQTSNDGFNWSDYTRGTTITLKDVGDKVYFKGDYRGISTSNYSNFAMKGKIAASGNVMTLTDGDNPTKSLKDKKYAFYSLFYGCTSLTSAPALPATTLADDCYERMFSGCTSLTSAPELPATTLADLCYDDMFRYCTSLKSAPELPATTLAGGCYQYMFRGCTSLTSAPALPATELADWCYYYMFTGCTSLTSAPALPATKLTYQCYYYMFRGCTKLNSIKVAFTDWNSATYATKEWVNGVASTGTFICKAELAKEFSTNRIPDGWTVQLLPEYLCFTAQEANSTISFNAYKNGGYGNVQASTDGLTWSDYTRGTTITLNNVGEKVYFKGNYRGTSGNYSKFAMTGKIAASGNVMTLTDGDNPTTSLMGKDNAFFRLFNDCTSLTSAPALPAREMADNCYYKMFSGCTSLTSAPALPATTLADDCYERMFSGCTKLNYIKVAFTDWDAATNATSDWVEGVSSTGTFICPAELAKIFDKNHIPNGWTVTSSYTLPRSYRFSTFSSNLATDFSGSGLTPYYVSDKNEDRTTVTLAPFENGIVPAGQGAVLYNANIIDGTSENFTVKVTAAAGTTPAVNYLKPALTAIDFPSASSAEEAGYKYMLGDEDKWWWINGGTLAANKAYLDLSSNPSAAKSFIMCFDEETTAISSSSNEKLGISNSADAYNLAGQRVSKDYKGIVIKNGKKFKN